MSTQTAERTLSPLWKRTRPFGDRGAVAPAGVRRPAVRNAWGEVWMETTDGMWYHVSRATAATFEGGE